MVVRAPRPWRRSSSASHSRMKVRHGPIDNRLRFANEPARHKVLDLVGDLSLLGADLYGHVVAYRSGHPLNVELIRTLYRRLPAWAAGQHLLAA